MLDALRAQNVQVAGGALGEPPVDYNNAFQVSLQMKGRLREADEFEDIIVKMGTDGRVVRVKDIGRVELGALSYAAQGYADQYPAVIVVVDQQPGSNAVRATQGIKDAIEEMAKSFPKGLEYRLTYNPTEFIEVSISKLYITILEATVLVVLVVLLFLKTWRATLIPVIAIPVSLIGTCAVMQAFGFTLNMLTLFGLVLAVGIVVDDAIVVVENVERKLKEGLSPLEAARVSMDEVGTALDRHRPRAAGRVHPDDVHRRHHRPVLSPVRDNDRHRHRHLAVPVADAQSGDVRAAVPQARRRA